MEEDADPFDLDAISWPAAGAQLFAADVPLSPPALLEDGPSRWWIYAESYRFAAAALVDRFRVTGYDQDFLALPVLFLYRQHVELSLKYLERAASQFLNRAVPDATGHRLWPRWLSVRGMLEEVWPNQYDADNDAVAELIAQLHRVDEGSDAFRYPVDVAGNQNLSDELKRLDLLHFAAVMETYAHWVGGATDALYAEADAKEDILEAEREAAPRDDEY